MHPRNYEADHHSLRKDALLDIGTDMSQRGSVETLAEVIGAVMIEHGYNQRTFGELVGEKQQTISKWVAGESVPTIDDFYNIEAKLNLWHGTILRRAGYVQDAITAREAIEADIRLSARGRERVLAAYDAVVDL